MTVLKLSTEVEEFHRQSIVIDAHCDSIGVQVAGWRDLAIHSKDGHLDLPRLRGAGVTAQFFASFIESEYKPHQATLRGLELVKGCLDLIAANPHELVLLKNYQDLEKASATGRTAAILSVEGGEILGGKLFMLPLLYKLGIRALGLTWNYANDLAGGVQQPGGLTKFGEDVVKTMNNLGMLVDVSHLADKAFWDVLQVSTAPVIASHSCCRRVHNHPRNLTDEQIKALAAMGGVLGIAFYTEFLTSGPATIEDIVRHIDHVCSLVGPDYVGIGSDFDGCESLPEGLEDVSRLPCLTQALFNHGYSREDIAKIIGGNFARVIHQVLK